MSTQSPVPNIEFYKKQANALFKAANDGDSEAVRRITAPDHSSAKFALHQAQFAIAREQGFPSWPKFNAFVTQSGLNFSDTLAAFVDAAFSDSKKADQILADNPKIIDAGLCSAVILGDSQRVEALLIELPSLAVKKTGPLDLDPLLYACRSNYAARNSPHSAGIIKSAELLLAAGANPNASHINPQWPDNPVPVLYYATGVNNNPELALVLLAHGASPNDNESVYHSTEHADLDCLRLLLEHGAVTSSTNALKHMLDREDPEGVKLLLDAGAICDEVNPNGETALHWAVWRGRSPQIVGQLIDGGATFNLKRSDGRTAYALAAISGQNETARLLESRGADTSLTEFDRFVQDAISGSFPDQGNAELRSIFEKSGDSASRMVAELIVSHQTAAVKSLLKLGAGVDGVGEAGGTALHWACWKGYADLVDLLLQHGASLTVTDKSFNATPVGWLFHGIHNCPDRTGDYASAVRYLMKAGARPSVGDFPSGDAGVDAVVAEYVER